MYMLFIFYFITLLISGQPVDADTLNANIDVTTLSVHTEPPVADKVYPLAIIGAGAAGTMAVKRSILNNVETLLFIGAKPERKRSRGYWVRTVDNMPGLSKYTRTLLQLRNETLEELLQLPLGKNLYVIEDSIYTIAKESDYFILRDASGRSYTVQHIVLATGMMDEQPHIQGSIRPILKYANGQTIAYCALCDGHRSLGKKTTLVGHTDTAASIAFLLQDKYHLTDMTLLTNGQPLSISAEIKDKLDHRHITLIQTPIAEVLGQRETKQLSGFKLTDGTIVNTEFAFIALGFRPNNQLAVQLGAQVDDRGLVLTDLYGESSIPNLFVAGDLRSGSLKQIYTAWQHAVDSIQRISQRLR